MCEGVMDAGLRAAMATESILLYISHNQKQRAEARTAQHSTTQHDNDEPRNGAGEYARSTTTHTRHAVTNRLGKRLSTQLALAPTPSPE